MVGSTKVLARPRIKKYVFKSVITYNQVTNRNTSYKGVVFVLCSLVQFSNLGQWEDTDKEYAESLLFYLWSLET